MRRGSWRLGCTLLFLLGALPARADDAPAAAQTDMAALVAQGQRIYREGIGTNGQPLKAMAAAQTVLTGSNVACAICHRRSGFGTAEGPFNIRPIIAPALFEEQSIVVRSPRIKAQLGTRLRPPYTPELLARAIRAGTDAAGEPLDPVMPRYAMSEQDLKAITAYLSTLSAKSSPGVDAEEIHFATVIQPGVKPLDKQVMLDVMQAFVQDKSGEARSDARRRDAGTQRMYRAFRKWVLHVWELTGPADGWRSQLEAFYKAQPVFALVGGLGGASWQPIHDFAEAQEIPSVFPLIDLPVTSGTNDYNFYFSKGLSLDAAVLAKYLRDGQQPARVVQIYRSGGAGATAASAFRSAMPEGALLDDIVLDERTDLAALWRTVAERKATAVVSWVDEQDMKTLAQHRDGNLQLPWYLSYAMLGDRLPADDLMKKAGLVRVVYPTDLPPKHESRLLRSRIWMHNKNIPMIDEALQVNTQFAMTVLSDGIGHIMDSFSRDYFVERVEHVVTQTPMPSLYQSVSLGPGQRFASKGGHVVELEPGERTRLKDLSGWIIP